MERRSTDFSLLSVARCPQRVRRACRLINIGHDKYPTIDASALLGTGSISIRSSLREFVILDRRAKYFFLPSFLPSSSVVVADSGLDSWARFDSRRERERTRQRKRKNRGGREGKKKKKENDVRLYAALPFDLPTTVAMLHGVTLYHAQNVTNDRAWNEDRRGARFLRKKKI